MFDNGIWSNFNHIFGLCKVWFPWPTANGRVTPASRPTYDLTTTKINADLVPSWLARGQLLLDDLGAPGGHLDLVGNAPNSHRVSVGGMGW